jgi:hypothetical protein
LTQLKGDAIASRFYEGLWHNSSKHMCWLLWYAGEAGQNKQQQERALVQ